MRFCSAMTKKYMEIRDLIYWMNGRNHNSPKGRQILEQQLTQTNNRNMIRSEL